MIIILALFLGGSAVLFYAAQFASNKALAITTRIVAALLLLYVVQFLARPLL
ncbi:MAG: hypothetical protein V4674_03780 [Patescibacteria group bacterium]